MRVRASVFITVVFLVLFGVFILGAGRLVSQRFVARERDHLISVLPLVYQSLASHPESLAESVTETARFSRMDITLLDQAGRVEASSLGEEKRAGISEVQRGSQALFQVRSIGGMPSFVLSSPLLVGSEEKTLVLSEPDPTVGAFFDDFLTMGLAVLIIGILGSVGAAWFLSHHEQVFIAEVGQAFKNLAEKQYGYRILEHTGGSAFAAARLDYNRAMEEFGKLNTSTDQFIRSRLVSGEQERRALIAALGSVPEGVFVIDSLGKIAAFNAKMEELTGWEAGTATGTAMSDLIAISGPSGELSGLIPKILSTGVPEVFNVPVKLKRRDGIFVDVSVKTIPVRSELRGAVTHVVVIMGEAPRQSEPQKQETAISKPEIVSLRPPTPRPESAPQSRPEVRPEAKLEPKPALPVRPPDQHPVALPSAKPPAPKVPEPLIIRPNEPKVQKSPEPVSPLPPVRQVKPETSVDRVIRENESGSLSKMAQDEAGSPPANLPV